MSSILDALKKSDQNRTGDNKTDVSQIKFNQNPSNKNKKGFWLLVILLLLVAIGVYGWQQGWHLQVTEIIQSWTASESPKNDNSGNKKAIVKTETELNKSKPTRQLVPPKQSDIKAQSKQVKKQKSDTITSNSNTSKKEEIVKTTELTNEEPVDTLEPIVAESNTTQTKPFTSNRSLKKINVATDDNADEPENSSKKRNNTKKSASIIPTLQQDYLLYHQIEYSIRKDIPQIKVNIHIYDPDPENRMVLINGERFNIGDTIEELVTIVDIVKEGVVVSFENIQFLIPK